MEAKINAGCFGDIITVNDIAVEDMSSEAIGTVCQTIISKLENRDQQIELLNFLIREVGEYIPDKEPCEQCGNWGETYIVNLD